MTADMEDATATLLHDMTRDGKRASEESARVQAEAKEQLRNLAAMTFWVFGERIGFLSRWGHLLWLIERSLTMGWTKALRRRRGTRPS